MASPVKGHLTSGLFTGGQGMAAIRPPAALRSPGAAAKGKAGGSEAAAQRHNRSKTRRKSVALEYVALASVPLTLVLGNSMLVPVLPSLARELGVTSFQSSLVITLFSVSAGLVIPVAGYLSDRFGRKRVMIPALLVYGGGGILAGLGAVWHSYGVLIAARALQGIGAAGTAPIAMALVGDLYKDAAESRAQGLIEAANGTGKVLSPIAGSLLALIVWYAVFWAFPAVCLLSALALLFFIREPKRPSSPQPLVPYLRSVADVFKSDGRWLSASFFAGAAALFILFGGLFFLSEVLEAPPHRIDGVRKGLVLAVPLLAMVGTSLTTGAVIKKSGKRIRLLINAGLLLMAVSLGLAIFLHDRLYVLIALLSAGGVGTGLVLPCLNTMITGATDKAKRGMITSLYGSLRFLGVALGPPLFGWLTGVSRPAVFGCVSALALIAFGLAFFLIKPGDKVR